MHLGGIQSYIEEISCLIVRWNMNKYYWRNLHFPMLCLCQVGWTFISVVEQVFKSFLNISLFFIYTNKNSVFVPVKLAIWEVSLDNFVESIQSIPEVIPIYTLYMYTLDINIHTVQYPVK